MPEYLAPGVFVEEVSFRAKSIEGVSTTTTGFIGPTRYGPLDIEPDIVTSLVEFERTYGGKERLRFFEADGTEVETDNFMWHAARAFFEEGGKRLYVSRVYSPRPLDGGGENKDPGAGCSAIDSAGPAPSGITIRARFPGAAGDSRVTLTFNLSQNVLVDIDPTNAVKRALKATRDRDVVMVTSRSGSPALPGPPRFWLARKDPQTSVWTFQDASGATVASLDPDLTPGIDFVHVVTVSVTVTPISPGGPVLPYSELNLPLDPLHRLGETPDSLFDSFAPHVRDTSNPDAKVIASVARARTVPIVIENAGDHDNGLQVLTALLDAPLASPSPVLDALERQSEDPDARSLRFDLTNGNDGVRPLASAYEGQPLDPVLDTKRGFRQFEDLEDISIVAAPGATFLATKGHPYETQAKAIVGDLINHAQKMRYRIAVLDSFNDQSISEVRAMRAQYDSTYAALYYPWVRVVDPLTGRENYMPPSGFVAGIYARNDINRAVYKAPANEVVNLALGFQRFLNKSQQEVLNPEGINCFRFFEGRGMRLWGARTISSDPEWKYVNLRRYFAYLERSIDKGTQWAVFEPNGDALWANVRRTIEDFLLNEWQNGALLGDKPEKAFFVKCDRSTMSQNDLDNGRLICLIGVAPLRPAEFVIFRIGQWTADRKV
jgi:phage tail sheath protein FI